MNNKEVPGLMEFKDVLFFSTEDVEEFNKIFLNNDYLILSESSYTKNILWNIFYKLDNLDFIKNIQKTLLLCLAEYVDSYQESVHSIQWQERIYLHKLDPGESEDIFNPSKSDSIENNIPFSRSIVVEIHINDNYSGGDTCWKYFDEFKSQYKSGSIVIYPANFLYSNKKNTIIDGRKIFLRTYFNGGKDFISEDPEIDGLDNVYMFSYMR